MSRRDIRPDAQAFDEIRMLTAPRFKESGLSGDEWRISATVQFMRKGKIVHEDHCGNNIESAIRNLGYLWGTACDEGKAYFAGIDYYCDQEGCSEKATVTYRKKKDWCSRCGEKKEWPTWQKEDVVRCVCDKHKHRGDCGLLPRIWDSCSGDRDGNDDPVCDSHLGYFHDSSPMTWRSDSLMACWP